MLPRQRVGLIESDWNLKKIAIAPGNVSVMGLIESDWNLKAEVELRLDRFDWD